MSLTSSGPGPACPMAAMPRPSWSRTRTHEICPVRAPDAALPGILPPARHNELQFTREIFIRWRPSDAQPAAEERVVAFDPIAMQPLPRRDQAAPANGDETLERV